MKKTKKGESGTAPKKRTAWATPRRRKDVPTATTGPKLRERGVKSQKANGERKDEEGLFHHDCIMSGEGRLKRKKTRCQGRRGNYGGGEEEHLFHLLCGV